MNFRLLPLSRVGKERRVFGYVKPEAAELLVKEYEFYKATYCGICRAMKKHAGFLSNVTLSYDSVFLALVRMLFVEDEEFSAKLRRCVAHPLKKRPMLSENSALIYTAKAFSVLAYHKLDDDAYDEKFAKKLISTLAKPLVSGAGRREDMRPLADFAAEKLKAIRALEREKCASVDMPSSLFGELLGEIFSFGLDGSSKIVTRECGYYLGKFIYAADAAEDYEKDRKRGSYNPYVLSYGGKELTDDNRATIKCALLLECTNLERAIELLPYGSRVTIENIIKNIIYLGLVKRISFLDGKAEKKCKE